VNPVKQLVAPEQGLLREQVDFLDLDGFRARIKVSGYSYGLILIGLKVVVGVELVRCTVLRFEEMPISVFYDLSRIRLGGFLLVVRVGR